MTKLFVPNAVDTAHMVDTAMSKFDQSQSLRRTFPNLVAYVERTNFETKMFYERGTIFDLYHFTNKHKEQLMERIDCDLSPENLCCDGELSGPKLRQKAQYLNAVKAELEAFVCL